MRQILYGMDKNKYKKYDWKQVSTQRKYWSTENQ